MHHFSLNCKGKIWSVQQPAVMAILNLTPDSFYDGGAYSSEKKILKQVEKFVNEGADIVDIGGVSTRLSADIISVDAELNRVLKPIQLIHHYFPNVRLSIDTYSSKVAEYAVQSGVSIINDITGGTNDTAIFEVAHTHRCPIILMHIQGTVHTMHQRTNYVNILTDIYDFFVQQIGYATKIGIKDVIVDVGFGFSKTMEQNYTLLKHLAVFQQLDKPILVGLSRKSMFYKLLQTSPDKALNATTVAHTIALQNGASFLRVHDVKEAKECITIYQQMQQL